MQMESFLNESSSQHQQHTKTYPSPLSTRLLDTLRLLQAATTGACNGTSATCQRIAELIGKLAARLVDVFAPLEHATAILPGLCWGRHCRVLILILFLLEDEIDWIDVGFNLSIGMK